MVGQPGKFSSRLASASRQQKQRAAWSDADFFRRAVGFTIKIDADKIGDGIAVATQAGTLHLRRDELRAFMALDHFQRWNGDRALLEKLEAHDLVYWSDTADGRTTVGAPIKLTDEVTLRDGVGVTVALNSGEDIAPWPFMARRGDLDRHALHGFRFSSCERGQEVYSVDLYGGPALRRLLPRMQHDPLRDLLNDCGLLAPAPQPMPLPRGSVAWLGHAAALVRAGDATVLVDPLFMRRSDPARPYVEAPFDWRTLPRIDAIALTHADNDHCNPGTLARLPPDVPVIIPKLSQREPYQVDMERMLTLLDFRRVISLATGESARVGDVQVTAAPFFGEDWGLSLQKATYVIAGPAGRVYLSADALNPPDVFEALGPVDFAFLGVSGCEEPLIAPPGFGYGEFYADWLPDARRNQWQRFTMNARQAAEAAVRLRAARVFGYAAGGGSFMDMAHADQGSHEELAALVPHAAVRLQLGVAAAIAG